VSLRQAARRDRNLPRHKTEQTERGSSIEILNTNKTFYRSLWPLQFILDAADYHIP
jgi:hypothetical protein